MESERGYHLTIPDPGVSLSRAITRENFPAALAPMDVGLRVAGTDEFAGLDAPPDWRRADVLWRNAKHILPGLSRSMTASAAGWATGPARPIPFP